MSRTAAGSAKLVSGTAAGSAKLNFALVRAAAGRRLLTAFGLVLTLDTLCLGLSSGCASESTRLALDVQRRADEVQEAVFDRQHEALCVLLYRDLVGRLAEAGPALTPAQRAALNDVWNDRDLIEFWTIQHERAKALRVVGVDAKLASDQPVIDLLIKAIEARADRAKQSLAAQAGTQAAEHITGE